MMPHQTPSQLKSLFRPTLLSVVVALLLLVAFAVLAAPLLPLHDPDAFLSSDGFVPPSDEYWLGTDFLGRDLLARLLSSGRVTLGMALLSTILAHLIGDTLGLLAALRGGWFDAVVSRIVDVVLSVPKIIAGLVVLAVTGPSLVAIVVLTAVVYAAGVFRIARALGQDLIAQDFITVARARGEGNRWLLFGEMLPHVVMPLTADFALRLSFAILFMSGLSFLGLGVQPPMADWGGLVRENLDGLQIGSWAPIYPALSIAVVSVLLNLFVDGLQEREKKGGGV
ncbi:ABC transporter permease [Azospirillum baldaniorum]|uniref:ABC Transporter, permease protein n=1 Tax=Azospirillum baldaniorum TaxID=1064539 RepID=A0A9P1JPN5_9PROT|nr:ABC transporter permease [Azospirillum baldaniorum]AWJ90504.1 ABC transporter permease [Azospirillum baldaniorum]TWA78705.1 peptide/nickel transport system permease protein [Azospirillum brasilense]CCC97332.1 putative ABC Transporter, permease protein [Azospirillum baldaniorum]